MLKKYTTKVRIANSRDIGIPALITLLTVIYDDATLEYTVHKLSCVVLPNSEQRAQLNHQFIAEIPRPFN